jgi:hypothetical protein
MSVLLPRRIFQQLRMGDFHEQRVCVIFCFKLWKAFSETFEMLKQAFGDAAMSRTKTHERYKRFKETRTSVEGSNCTGQPSTSKSERDIREVRKVIRSNHLTVREVGEEVGISKTAYRELLNENLGMRHVDVSKEFVGRANADENFLKNIVTGDETWVYGYDVETKAHSSQWDSEMSPIPKKSTANSVQCDSSVVFLLLGRYLP